MPSQTSLHLFAGAGGGLLADLLLGHRPIGAVERSPARQNMLRARQRDGMLPAFPIFSDVRTFNGRPYRGRAGIVAGGFPCQAYSSAASGRNTADDLWPEMRRVVADVAPRYVFAENVQARAIDQAADDLEQMGYQTRALALSAADLGGDHIRPRYWLLAYADSDGELCSPLNAEAPLRSRICPGVWQAEPDQSRMADGLDSGVDALRATGDGQIPIVAATAWRLLAAAAKLMESAPPADGGVKP